MKLCANVTDSLSFICNQDEIIKSVKQVVQQNSVRSFEVERRSAPRHPYPYLVKLVPFENDCENQPSPIYVAGKHLGSRGFDFFHNQPISFRQALVGFPGTQDQIVQFVIKIDWCRFLETGWYESGGRFIKLVQQPKVQAVSA